MKTAHKEQRNGSVMIFAVLLMSAGIFVLAAVLQLAATQGVSGEAEWAALQRRVTLGNSRAMAREYMLSRIFRGPVPANTNQTSAGFSNALGGFSISPAGGAQADYWTALSTTNTDVVLNINPFNLMERGGFYREIFQGDLLDGNTNTDGATEWSFALRTRSPVAAGYSFVQQRPGANNLATLASPPYIDMSSATEKFTGFEGMPRMPLSSVTNVMTRSTGDTNGYQGFLDAPAGASAYGLFTNVTFTLRSTNPAQLAAELDLEAPDDNLAVQAFRYEVPSTHEFVTNNVTNYYPVTSVVLQGSDTDQRKPLHVIVPQTNTTLTLLVLSGDNDRRVYFYRSKAANDGVPLDVVTDNADTWRLGMTMSQCDIQFEIGNLEVMGGLRTDGDIVFQGGSANFVPEEDPGGLDFIADRMMWLEDYRAQQ